MPDVPLKVAEAGNADGANSTSYTSIGPGALKGSHHTVTPKAVTEKYEKFPGANAAPN